MMMTQSFLYIVVCYVRPECLCHVLLADDSAEAVQGEITGAIKASPSVL